MAIKKISEFVAGTPTSDSKILFEQNEKGKSCTVGDAVNACSLSYEEIMTTNPVPDLTNKVASASSVKTLGDSRENWKNLSDLLGSVVPQFETQFNTAEDHTVVTLQTHVGREGGGIMFKHSASYVSCGIIFHRDYGAKIIKRNTDATWYYREIL